MATVVGINGGTRVFTRTGRLPKALHWSTATLPDDGTVPVGGGGATGPQNNLRAQQPHLPVAAG